MRLINPTRRWLQFSLRSVLLLILLVALWLGFEARHANHVERHVAAIRDTGGQVDFEPCWWSVLKFVDAQRYGVRAVGAEIDAKAALELSDHLAELAGLRELRVGFDGTADIAPVLDGFSERLPHVRVTPVVTELSGTITDLLEPLRARNKRLRARLLEKAERDVADNRILLRCLREFELSRIWCAGRAMRFVPVGAKRPAELIVLFHHALASHDSDEYLAVLLLHDRIIDWRHHKEKTRVASLKLVWEDFDQDGVEEMGFEVEPGFAHGDGDDPGRKLGSDPRIWLDVYKIERTGFRSLFDENHAKGAP